METALPRRLEISAVICQAEVFSGWACWPAVWSSHWFRGPPCFRNSLQGVCVSLYNSCGGDKKKRCKEYKFRFSFKGWVEAEGLVTEGTLVIVPLRTWFFTAWTSFSMLLWPTQLHTKENVILAQSARCRFHPGAPCNGSFICHYSDNINGTPCLLLKTTKAKQKSRGWVLAYRSHTWMWH